MDDFDVAIRDLRHMARGNGPVMRIADRLVAARGGMGMPRDKNGRLVYVGDTARTGGEVFTVSSVDYGHHPTLHDGLGWALWSEGGDFYELATQCEVVDSVEVMLRKFYEECADGGCVGDLIEHYAKRLRVAGGADD